MPNVLAFLSVHIFLTSFKFITFNDKKNVLYTYIHNIIPLSIINVKNINDL